jgi:hypothetical protein
MLSNARAFVSVGWTDTRLCVAIEQLPRYSTGTGQRKSANSSPSLTTNQIKGLLRVTWVDFADSTRGGYVDTYPTRLNSVGYGAFRRIPQRVILWDMTVLTTPHERALTLLFSELERSASEQFEVLLGTPGTLAERTNETGTRFWVHRYSDALNRRQ